jgi:parallel beta-helix repeat protein
MKYILCVLSLFVILMIIISGCTTNTTQTVQKAIKPQGTVEPPAPVAKSVLSTNVIPAPTKNTSPEIETTLSYGIYYSGPSSDRYVFKPNDTPEPIQTVVVVPSPTLTPNTTFIPVTPTPTPIITPTPIPGSILETSQYIKADGSDETEELQYALDYAKNNNYDGISFPNGKIIGISEPIYIPSDIEIIGNGCTIKLLDDSNIGHWVWTIDTGSNVYIHNLKIDGNKDNQPYSTDPNYYFPRAPNDGIAIRDNGVFDNNEVFNFGGYSVESLGYNVVIKNNIIHDGWQYGITTAGSTNNAIVTGNTIYRMGQVGIKITSTSNSLFDGNIITIPGKYDLFDIPSIGSPSPTGIRLYSFDGSNDHIAINKNIITGVNGNNNEIGIESDNSENTYITITNNQIKNSRIGINVNFDNGVITGNSISGCNYNIIYDGVIPTPTPTQSTAGTLYISDYVKADGSDETVKLQSAFNYAESHNIKTIIFPTNKIIGVTDTVLTGHNEEIVGNGCTIMLINDSIMDREEPFFRVHEGCHIYGMKFFGNMYNQSRTLHGLNDMGLPSATNGLMVYSDVLFENNEVSNVGAYSITLWQMDNTVLRNNIIHDTYQYGIALKAGDDNYLNNNITITGNTFYRCYQVGIKIAGASNSIISNNIVNVPPTMPNNDDPSGITLYSLDWRNKNILITDNVVTGNSRTGQGIGSQTSDNANSQIKNNKISNLGWGIDVNINNGVITGNTISNCTTPLTSTGTGNTISGNIITTVTTPTPTPTKTSTPVPTTVPTTISPNSPVKLIFIHHSSGWNWLSDSNGGLGKSLMNNNYYVSDTHYGWGSSWGTSGTIGDHTDIGDWWTWFRGPNTPAIMGAVYNYSKQNSAYYSRLSTDPGGKNKIIMFKSCYPNSELYGSVNDPIPSIGNNPMKGQSSGDDSYTISNAKGIYIDLLEYFKLHQDTLFVVITAPPLSDSTYAGNARAFNTWLVNDWLKNYPYKNVIVFDFYNTLTTNGGSATKNDVGSTAGNHHRILDGQVQWTYDGVHNTEAYWSGDDHPGAAGNQKATAEFVPYLNFMYNRWKNG